MTCSYVVTGGGRGVGRAIVERLSGHGHVVALDRDADALGWTADRPAVEGLAGDGADERTLRAAVDRASRAGTLTGWVNNAAVFRDAAVHDTPVAELLELITANLALAVAGSAAAIRRFLADDTAGAIVNVSSHQAQRAVPGALPYATAKAAIEGLTRALAVDYASRGIRVNAVALGSIGTERYDERLDEPLRRLHPLGRVGRGEEVAAVVAHLLSAEAGFVTGAVVPVDGGRAAPRPGPRGTRRHRERPGLTMSPSGRRPTERTVAAKMGIEPGGRAFLAAAPTAALAEMRLPELDVEARLTGRFDYVHLFATSQRQLDERFPVLKEHLAAQGMLWVSWPKGRQLGTDLTLPVVIRIGYDHGLVESTTLSIDPTWSAIKFTHPKAGKVYRNRYGRLPGVTRGRGRSPRRG